MEAQSSAKDKLYRLIKEDRERRAQCQKDVEELLFSIKDSGKDYSVKLMGIYDERRSFLVDASLFLYEEEIFNDLMKSFLSAYQSMKDQEFVNAFETLQKSTFCKLC